MFEKLRRRFFRIALIAMTAAMVLVTAAINIINWLDVRSELMDTLTMLAENETRKEIPQEGLLPGPENRSRHEMNLLQESRFFVASMMQDGTTELHGPPQDETVTEEESLKLVQSAAETGQETGRLDYFFFRRFDVREDGSCHYIFLNAETRLSDVRRLIFFSVAACAFGILLAMAAVSRFSRKAIEPLVQNSREQKQFITDASHELKTPLTVISANMDVLSLDVPGNTWIRSTQKQVAQMRRLVDELVYLSRLEESGRPLETASLSLPPLLEDVAEPFAAMAEFQGKSMEIHAAEGLTIRGDEDAVRRMISTLCDNAVKYAAEEGSILVEARPEGRQVLMRFSNTVSEPLTPEQCSRLFQRFYRTDASRNKEKKNGFGIGLAIAAAIAEKHGGSIRAEMEGENRLVISCLLPAGT